jgi:predicted RNA-binding protein YlxR (DUF448 family)/ribosomal protein L30E
MTRPAPHRKGPAKRPATTLRQAEGQGMPLGRERTCVGCGRTDEPGAMARVVAAPDGQIAVDLSGGAFGRGAYVHPSRGCLASAPRGLTKSFRRPVDASAARLAGLLESAANRRIGGLLGSAVRSGQVALGAEAAGGAWQTGRVDLLVVARDAAAAAAVGSVMQAIAQGGAIAWGTKAELGRMVGRSELAVLGIASRSISTAVRSAMAMASSVGPREAMQEPPSGAAVATEDR